MTPESRAKVENFSITILTRSFFYCLSTQGSETDEQAMSVLPLSLHWRFIYSYYACVLNRCHYEGYKWKQNRQFGM